MKLGNALLTRRIVCMYSTDRRTGQGRNALLPASDHSLAGEQRSDYEVYVKVHKTGYCILN